MSLFVANEESKFMNEGAESNKEDDDDSHINKGFDNKINPKLVQGRKSKIVLLDNLIASMHTLKKGRAD